MTIRSRIAVTILPIALVSPIAHAEDGSKLAELAKAAEARSAAVSAWAGSLVKNRDLGASQKVPMIVEALRKEVAPSAPGVALNGTSDIATQEVSTLNGIQMEYIVALMQIGDPDALQTALLKERNSDVRDRLSIAMGRIFTTLPDSRQEAVYPRIIQLVQSNTEASARFPYEQAVKALANAAKYPSFKCQVIPLLTTVAARGGAGTSQEARLHGTQAGMAAKDALRIWGYSLVRDSSGQLQSVRKAKAAKPATSK